jgi:hypothetical protein
MPTPGLHGIAAGRFAAKVNLNTIREVKQPRSADDDLRSLRWPALQGVSRQLSWWAQLPITTASATLPAPRW